ncbi:hypothetical protein BMG03_19135 (plasmid) [Thioclava nitratireducens]|uniref:Integrase n=1 Tax=Thioclava nitratireducens TaxID=1915078 RepID=A0ABM6IME0_9RHOB|nr:hypothetical protein BMG03_19135 [Thioclava nitratireducens]
MRSSDGCTLKTDFGSVFVTTSRYGKRSAETRLNDKHVAPDQAHCLRRRLASSAEVDERYAQKQLGHTSAK